ncbi:MAG: hypothetical protein IPL21_06365 [Saprospirales bacterium]|nr:hypothetical protein [Saprospirales bacterium]
MKKSKFFELLSSFNKKQLQELSKLIKNNEEENLIGLFNYLSIHIPSKSNDTVFSREAVLRNLYKNKLDEKNYKIY